MEKIDTKTSEVEEETVQITKEVIVDEGQKTESKKDIEITKRKR